MNCILIGQHSIAVAIVNTHHSSLSQSLSDPVGVARLLHGECVITGAVLANVESTGQSLSDRRKVLLAAVREAVQINYQSLQTLGTVLCKFTGNAQLGSAILSDYGEYSTVSDVVTILLQEKFSLIAEMKRCFK